MKGTIVIRTVSQDLSPYTRVLPRFFTPNPLSLKSIAPGCGDGLRLPRRLPRPLRAQPGVSRDGPTHWYPYVIEVEGLVARLIRILDNQMQTGIDTGDIAERDDVRPSMIGIRLCAFDACK